MRKSIAGKITSQKFDESEVGILIKAKSVAPWLSSSQQEAAVQLLGVECENDGRLKDVVLRLMSWIEMFRPEKYREEMGRVLKHLIRECGFEDEKSKTKIIGIIERSQSDGCSIPCNLIRNAGVYMRVSPEYVNVEWTKIQENVSAEKRSAHKLNNIANSIKETCGEDVENVILVDDFVGTGTKIIRYAKAIRLAYPKTKLAILSLISMRDGMVALGKAKDSHQFVCHYFEGAYPLNGQKLTEVEIETIRKFEEALGVSSEYVLGYKESMALSIIVGHAASNNVFALFWFNNKGSRPVLFGR